MIKNIQKKMEQNKVVYWVFIIFVLLVTVGIFTLIQQQAREARNANVIVVDNGETESKKWNVLFIRDSTIQFFHKYHQIVNQFPDKIIIHEPYLIVVKPGDREKTSTVHNLLQKTQQTVNSEMLLDYTPSHQLTTDNLSTFLNGEDLHIQCAHGFIKNAESILCTTPKKDDPMDNKIVEINPKTGKITDYYQSDRAIVTFTLISNKLYIGEQDLATQQYYLTIDEKVVKIPSLPSLIYPMEGRVYYATRPSNELGREASYTLIEEHDDTIVIDLIEKGRIVFN